MKCPECGNQEWYEGPSAGIAVNIACGNGHWWNDAGPFGLQRLDDRYPRSSRRFPEDEIEAREESRREALGEA